MVVAGSPVSSFRTLYGALLADGAFPVCSAGDVLVALSLAGAVVSRPGSASSSPSARVERAEPSGEQRIAYEALQPDPTPLDELARVTGMSLPALCGALESLAQAGLARDLGGWWERA